LPLTKYDTELTESTVQASWSKTSGLIFPLLDAGVLVTRSYLNYKIEDFTAGIYVKTLFKEIFNPLGIKLEGNLFQDFMFNTCAVFSNGKSQAEIDNRSTYANKTTTQTGITAATKITFENDSSFPFFDGSQNNFVSSTYTADIKIIVNVTLSMNVAYGLAAGRIFIYKNGVAISTTGFGITTSVGVTTVTVSENISLNAGDTLEVYVTRAGGVGVVAVNPNSTIKITPTFIYKFFGKSSVPNWSKGQLVSNILRVFNVLPSYNPYSKTLTLDLFNRITEKEPIDISDNVTITDIDFSEFLSSYGKSNIFQYQEGSDEDLRKYNVSNFISYGSGEIVIDNDFTESSADVVNSDFTSPITYINGAFDTSMERINFVEFDEIDDLEITSVTDSSGIARIQIADADDLFTVGDLVRLETNVSTYNGEWVINAVTSTYITVNGFEYDTTATGTATLLRHKFTTDESVYLLAITPNLSTLFFSSKAQFYLGASSSFTSASLSYFNLLSNGREINAKYKQSLSFGSVNNPLSYQRTMLDTYWPIFGKILNDPVMLRCVAYFNLVKYDQLKTFLRPLRVRTNTTNNLYYLNRITGYKSGHAHGYPGYPLP